MAATARSPSRESETSTYSIKKKATKQLPTIGLWQDCGWRRQGQTLSGKHDLFRKKRQPKPVLDLVRFSTTSKASVLLKHLRP
jgi:hypothetical protein